MSTLLWIDPSGGVAGDMLCGALLDAGASLQRAKKAVEDLQLPAEISCERVHRGSFAASYFQVHCTKPQDNHRHYSDIKALLQNSKLSPSTQSKALAVFKRLALVESQAHGIELEAVHFHEVGAIDSIVDVVVFCDLLEELGVDRILGGPIPVGTGTIQVAHGELTLPTPALLGLTKNWTLRATGRIGEQSTPTGVALLTTLGEEASLPELKPQAYGHGAGTRNPSSHANMTRVVLGEAAEQAHLLETICVLECQVDDMLPEFIPELIHLLMEKGALDAYSTPILMKKGRPGFAITTICRPSEQSSLTDLLFEHSSTLGVRVQLQERATVERHSITVETPWGPCRVKIGEKDGNRINAAPEFEDCKRLANQAGIAIKRVYAWALANSLESEE